jgi:hypothetical protein
VGDKRRRQVHGGFGDGEQGVNMQGPHTQLSVFAKAEPIMLADLQMRTPGKTGIRGEVPACPSAGGTSPTA